MIAAALLGVVVVVGLSQVRSPGPPLPEPAPLAGSAQVAPKISPLDPPLRREPVLEPVTRKERGGRRGTLVLGSNLAAFVRERGAVLGMTPLSVVLPAGKHRLSLKTADGLFSTEIEVLVPAGGTLTRQVALQ